MGETPEIDGVLGLQTEKINKGVPFDVFQEKMQNYILKKSTVRGEHPILQNTEKCIFQTMTRLQRIQLHLTCLLIRPSNWKFYVAGIFREIKIIEMILAFIEKKK